MEPLFKVYVPKGIIEELGEILYSGKLAPGVYVKEFEAVLCDFLGVDNFLAVNSYNSAADIVWKIINIKEGDEIIASPMSCLASNQPIVNRNGNIKWTDIDPYVGSLDPRAVKNNITKNTKAILHYHWGGYPGHINEIIAIGNEYGIPVVEDAIESFGSEYNGNKLGNSGADYTIFSFQPVRLPTTIDGGGIVCKHFEDYQKAVLIRDYGIDRQNFRDGYGEIKNTCDISLSGIGAGLNEIGAYIGLETMKNISGLLETQRQNAGKNEALLRQFGDIDPVYKEDTLPNYWIYTFLTKKQDKMLRTLRGKGIYASRVHLRNDYYSVFGDFCDDLKGVKKFNDQTLSIPCGWWVNYDL